MKKSEKIGIIIVVVLAVVFAVSIFAGGGSGKNKSTVKNVCEIMCYSPDQTYWTFSGANADIYYYTKEECVAACKIVRKLP